MMEILCRETLYTYMAYHLVKAFFPEATVQQSVQEELEPLIQLILDDGSSFCVQEKEIEPGVDRREKKREAACLLYQELVSRTGKTLPWGILTGVRPTKLAMEQLENGYDSEEIIKFLNQSYKVSDSKARLAVQIVEQERELLKKLDPLNGFSLYLDIPFCPSICSYCSFSSSPIRKWQDQVDSYLDALCREIDAISDMTKGKKLQCVYIGGGTPTTLSPVELDRLLGRVSRDFDCSNLLEFTVEAGRPDSITEEKLKTLQAYPVDRISINPQTMQQKTLDRVGRKHTVEDIVKAYEMARKMGFTNINMDLIAGLPGETADDMADTLEQIKALDPDNLTVHSLAIKRAAKMGQDQSLREESEEISEMIEESHEASKEMEMSPYYLYRQKNIAGNFENVGYAKVDKAGIYNILIMEEKQTIYGAGTGATTKFVLPNEVELKNGKVTNLIRVENVKDIREYMKRIDEMISRKGAEQWR